MTEEGNGSGKIVYTVRELLNEIKTTLQVIESKLDNKAEKSIVENMDKRLSTMETVRTSDLQYGSQLISEFRELQKGYHSNREAITVLETSKKDKDAFNILWVPIVINIVMTVAVILSRFVHI